MMARSYFIVAGAVLAASALMVFGLHTSPGRAAGSPRDPIIHSVPIDAVLEEIAEGKKVVFVDAREHPEYAEGHIPGAIDLPLRRIDDATRDAIGKADLVVAYCIKDFRGYEVARRLQELGVPNTHIMHPYGLNGWKDRGLPVATTDPASERAAQTRLQRCARHREACKGAKS